ncbi:Arf-GAP with coiled-coil, ANK repeat and PH domain-containing protein 3 [Lonchura striata]|uniref:Arf-GAP with coiled-coil, ANK repeat and PH domain-containing protein n=1 Tax=Lonchura striata TaxID=40157 RepID=A0A218UQQ0_9PASE|nr:Arf-GAP with coiled-coil, ANK repeat and PH domain-containing protein 3 [Lonchura striata domestica]
MFGATIDEVETDVVEIEAKLDKECLDKFGDSLQEMINYHMILFDQAQRSVRQQLHNFVKDDVRKFKETKKQFDRVREDMEISLVKNAQAPRHKPHEVEEATGTLSITRKCFRHLALDYVLQINVLQAKKKFEILDAMLSFMHAQFTFFQQGSSLLQELEPYMKKLASELDQLVIASAVEKREMEHKHALIQQRVSPAAAPAVPASPEKFQCSCQSESLSLLQDFSYDDPKMEFNVDAPNGVVMEGYLFKRASNAFKTWNRRWFSIQNSQLVYQKKLKDVLTVVVEDLRLCTVKPCEDIERRFCFEVVSPTKSCMLQADSEKLRQAWIQAVQASIASAYRESPDCYYSEVGLQRGLHTVFVQSFEKSSQLGKGGRSLGVHCSKVRSLTLDSWEPELLKLMCELGNSTMNQIYEAQCEELGLKKPTAGSSRQDKEAWIKVKYVEKKFLKKLPGGEVLAESERKPRRWCVKKCQRHHSGCRAPAARRKFRQEPGSAAAAVLASAATLERKFCRDSLFCPDELDSLFSYFDTGAGSGPRTLEQRRRAGLAQGRCSGGRGLCPVGPAGLSSDSGLGGSTDGSSDVLGFGAVVDSVTEEECEVSEDSSGEAELEPEASDAEEVREPALALCRAARRRALPALAAALAHGADVNWANEEDEGKTPLIQAVSGGSLLACEFLLQNGADVNQRDARGRAPLHHATSLGHTGQVCLFLKRGATPDTPDGDGQDPLSIAVSAANADIVTLTGNTGKRCLGTGKHWEVLGTPGNTSMGNRNDQALSRRLRLARMNEEMREAEGPLGQPGQFPGSSPTELQYRKCIQEFISLNIDET